MRIAAALIVALVLTLAGLAVPALPTGIETASAQNRADRIRTRTSERQERIVERLRRLRRAERMESVRRIERARLRRWMEIRRDQTLEARRRAAVEGLLMRDRGGNWRVRGEILSVALRPGALERVQARGFEIARRRELPALGLDLLVLRAPPGLGDREALALVRQLVPEGRFALHHLLDPSASGDRTGSRAPDDGILPWADLPALAEEALGLIDLGVDIDHPVLADARIRARGFAGTEAPVPSAHGTAIASLLVGRADNFRGAALGATLHAADVFGEAETGGSIEAVLEALDWMMHERVPIIAMPLVGPPNPLLETALARVAEEGAIVVAPVGNGGPTEAVAHPAAYPAVVAVTATRPDGRIFVSAQRGPEVVFAAVGVALPAAADPAGLIEVEGTSFAVPEVAARLLRRYDHLENPSRARNAIAALREQAVDLGEPGRDPVYGEGWVSYFGIGDRLAEHPSTLSYSPEKE